MESKITPIVICGAARSGTTFLTNFLCNHDEVAGIQHELHHGSMELNVCALQGYFGEWKNFDEFVSFLAVFSQSDFFLAADADIRSLMACWPISFFDFFFELLDQTAVSRGNAFWVIKYDPRFFSFPQEERRFLKSLKKRYSSPVFIQIERPGNAVIRSYLQMEGHRFEARKGLIGGMFAAVIGAARWVQCRAGQRKLEKEFGGLRLTFEQVTQAPAETKRLAATACGISEAGFAAQASIPPPNTSFTEGQPKSNRKFERAIGFFFLSLFRVIPFIADVCVKSFERTKKSHFPFYFRVLKSKYAEAELLEDLGRRGAEGLLAQLKTDSTRLPLGESPKSSVDSNS